MLSKTLLLTGSGEFTEEMKYVDSYALSFADQSKRRIAIIPTAAGEEADYKKWVEMAKEHFGNYGYDAYEIPVLKREDAENPEIVEKVKEATFIYFSGGNPGYLWSCVKDTLLIKTVVDLYNEGVVLAGSSAGAWILGAHVLTNIYEIDKGSSDTPVWEKALGLVNYTIIPHYDRALTLDKALFDKILDKTSDEVKNTLLGLDENTSLLLTDDHDGMVLGRSGVHVVINGKDDEYKSGSFFSLS